MKIEFTVIFIILFANFIYCDSDKASLFYGTVVRVARNSIGMTNIPPLKDKVFTDDCIGFVRYVYFSAGLDLVKAYGKGRGGVSSLYDGLCKRGAVYTNQNPVPGDLIFFDNTYDVNHDGKWDDSLSHVAIVEAVDKHNTIYYIDFSSGKVTEERLNLSYPDTYAFRQKNGELLVINSFLRKDRGEGFNRKEYISSSFFRAFAHIRVR